MSKAGRARAIVVREKKRLTAEDYLAMFCKGKKPKEDLMGFKIEFGKYKELILSIQNFDGETFSELAKRSVVNGEPLLVIDPLLANRKILSILYGAFNNRRIFWKQRLEPLTIERAIEIYEQGTGNAN